MVYLPDEIIREIMSYHPKDDITCIKLKKFININIDLENIKNHFNEEEILEFKPFITHSLLIHLTYHLHLNFWGQFKACKQVNAISSEETEQIRKHLTINKRIPHQSTLFYFYNSLSHYAHLEFKKLNEEVMNKIYLGDIFKIALKKGWETRLDHYVVVDVDDVKIYSMFCHKFLIERMKNLKYKKIIIANSHKLIC